MARASKTLRLPRKGVRGRNRLFQGYTGTALLTPAPAKDVAKAVPPSSPSADAAATPPPTPRNKMRTTVEKCLLMQLGGMTKKEAAVELGVTYGTLRQYFYIAGVEGWLDGHANVEDSLQYSTVHKIVRNINSALDGEDADKKQEMTIEAAKGLGLFKKHEVVSNDQAPAMMALSVKIEQPRGDEADLAVGSIGGTPAYSDAE